MSTNQLETETKNNNQEQQIIKEQDIPEKEKAFLTDTTSQMWMKTNTGKTYIQANYIQPFAETAAPLFQKLKHKESIDLFGYTYTYYDDTDSQGNKKPDSIGRVYRYPKGLGGGGTKAQFIPKRTKSVKVVPHDASDQFLALDPNHHWKLVGHEYHQSDIPEERKILLIFEWVENIPR
jgi:hypothetical protein